MGLTDAEMQEVALKAPLVRRELEDAMYAAKEVARFVDDAYFLIEELTDPLTCSSDEAIECLGYDICGQHYKMETMAHEFCTALDEAVRELEHLLQKAEDLDGDDSYAGSHG